MQLSGRAKLCLAGFALGSVFGVILGVVIAAALHVSGNRVAATFGGSFELVALITGLCAIGGLLHGYSTYSEP